MIEAVAGECIRLLKRTIKAPNRKSRYRLSIAFPLMGTGAGGLSVLNCLAGLCGAACDSEAEPGPEIDVVICFPPSGVPSFEDFAPAVGMLLSNVREEPIVPSQSYLTKKVFRASSHPYAGSSRSKPVPTGGGVCAEPSRTSCDPVLLRATRVVPWGTLQNCYGNHRGDGSLHVCVRDWALTSAIAPGPCRCDKRHAR